MIEPKPLVSLLLDDRLLPLQSVIVARLLALLPGVAVVRHPGKVDISELIAKSVVAAPGVGIGWSRIREIAIVDGSFSLSVEWTAYIVAEAKVIDGRRVEKEALALAIGARLLQILGDDETAMWGLTGILPPETTPQAELKPLFTVRDASQGVAYYTVTWTQIVVDLGETAFPTEAGTYSEEDNWIKFASEATLEAMRPFIPAKEEPDNA